jgi:predicted transcriptional regulator of viral defense system
MDADSPPTILCRTALDHLGLTKHGFYALIRAGEYEQIAPGTYLRPGVLDDTTAGWVSIACRKPAATICLLTALALHDLTDEIPRASDVALPRGERALSVAYIPVRWHSFDKATFDLGRGRRELVDGIAIGVYSPERTIVDAYRLRHELGSDLATEALKRWLRRRGSKPAELLAVAQAFPKALPGIRSALEILL